jgi:hypothetical protein
MIVVPARRDKECAWGTAQQFNDEQQSATIIPKMRVRMPSSNAGGGSIRGKSLQDEPGNDGENCESNAPSDLLD